MNTTTTKNENTLTFGAVNSMQLHRRQLNRKLDGIRARLSGRAQPLLSGSWTDADARQLAHELSSLMVQVYNLRKTVFDDQNPYPENDTPLSEIKCYNPYFSDEDDEVFIPTDKPKAVWEEALHCGILIAAGDPSFCYHSSGTFADLEDLFLGTIRSGAGPILQFQGVLDSVWAALRDGRREELEQFDFGPTPPVFDTPQSELDQSRQYTIQAYWEEWNWLNHFHCADALRSSIQTLMTDENFPEFQSFVEYYIGLEDILRQAVDLYLYQKGVSGMLENRYYATYALLTNVQKELEELENEDAQQDAVDDPWALGLDEEDERDTGKEE